MSDDIAAIIDRLDRIERLLNDRRIVKDWYTVEEVAKIVDRECFTVREWARLGRIHAEKRQSGRGKYPAWVVSHQELQRFQREGLLPQHKQIV